MRNVRRTISSLVAGMLLAAAAVVAWQSAAAADSSDAGRGHGMQRMAELMESGNPGMARMHEQMMRNDRARQAHERMMPDADMARMHQGLPPAPAPGS